MAREVDRLLAQLTSTGSPPPARVSRPAPSTRRRTSHVSPSSTNPRVRRAGLWARVVLGTTLGVLITQWPYPHDCGIPLAGYLGAVATVMVAGIWIAAISWKLRSAAAHAVAFLLLLWGCALAAERVLPRIGYAAEQGSWTCKA